MKPPKTPQEEGYDFEARFGEILGMDVTRGSGNQWFAKGDLGSGAMLGECKHTTHQSFSVTKALFRKLLASCRGEQEPFMAIDVDGEIFIVQRAGDWIASRTEEGRRFFAEQRSEAKRQTSRTPLLLRETE